MAEMNEKPAVTAIYGFEPQREGALPTAFVLGGKYRGQTITAIEYTEHNYGDHGLGWYAIMCGDDLVAEIQARAVAEVYYTQPAAREGQGGGS